MRTADLRGPVIFYLFLEIRNLRGPLMRGPYLNSFLFVIVSLIVFKTSHVQDTIFKSIEKLSNIFLKLEDILHVFDLTKILFHSMIFRLFKFLHISNEKSEVPGSQIHILEVQKVK